MIFLLDNYDSFTYNIYQMLRVLGQQVVVRRNDQISVAEIEAMQPSAVFLSPGPGQPEQAGIMQELIAALVREVPFFGVCLGMQGLGLYFGAKVIPAQQLMHGKICALSHNRQGIFTGLADGFQVMRYHSLALGDIPETELEITAWSVDDECMAISHRELPVAAVQFHPESFACAFGSDIISRFIFDHVKNT